MPQERQAMSVEPAYVQIGSARTPFNTKPAYFHLLALTLAVYGYVIAQLLRDEWVRPESGHDPIILILALWLIYRRWDGRPIAREVSALRGLSIFFLFAFAAAMYVVGIIGQISPLAYASIIPFLLAAVLLFQGHGAEAKLIFPIAFVLL